MANTDPTLFPPAPENPSFNWLVAVIDSPTEAERAVLDLRHAGFAEQDILLLNGEEAQERMRLREEHRGPMGWIMKEIADLVTDADEFERNYLNEAQRGHSLVNLQVEDEQAMERARKILLAHDAHYIKHFGEWVIADLS